jgi:glycosyltransferase involved in cell wall biosynthesis
MKTAVISFTGTVVTTHYIFELCTALSEIKDINVLVPDYANVNKFGKTLNVIKFPFPSSLIESIFWVVNPFTYIYLMKKIKEINPDLIHIPFEMRFPFYFELFLSKSYPIVLTVHEPKPTLVTKSLSKLIIQNLKTINCYLLCKYADKVIVHGNAHRDYLVGKGVHESKIKVISLGDFSTAIVSKVKDTIREDKNNILFFGRIEDYKGIEYLIQAGKIVEKYIPDITITIAGKGNFSKYKQLIGTDSHFIVINKFLEDEEVATLFQKTSLVVLPYIVGSQSGVISIAYAFKKPVIVTDVGNFSEMVENEITGLIVPPKDHEALARAIIRLLNDNKLRNDMGLKGSNLSKDLFSWNIYANKTRDIYQKVAES